MFKKKFVKLCNERGVSPTTVLQEIGLAKSTFTYWTDKTIPRMSTVLKLARYFDVSPSELVSREDTDFDPKSPKNLTPEEYRIIEAYRSASRERKESVCILLGVKVEQKQTEKKKTSVV